MIEYRRAAMDDIDALAKMRIEFLCECSEVDEKDKAVLLDNNRQYFYNSILDESFIAWLALDDGKLVATSGLSIYTLPPNRGCPNGKNGYISNMYTIPAYRCKGIATKLFSLTVEEAKSRGCEKILLNATEMGRPIYKKFGFEDSNNTMTFYSLKE